MSRAAKTAVQMTYFLLLTGCVNWERLAKI